jgi:hypothetical protein
LPPHTRYSRSGIDQNSVKVEQQRGTGNFIHHERFADSKLRVVLRF